MKIFPHYFVDQYIERRCIDTRIPLIHTNTRSTSYLVECYSSTNELLNTLVSFGDIHKFSFLMDHTIKWTSANFYELFTIPIQQANRCEIKRIAGRDIIPKTVQHHSNNCWSYLSRNI